MKHKTNTTEAERLLRSYAAYRQQFYAETYAKTYFANDGEFQKIGTEDPREIMELIESLVASFAPSNMATLLNLHYINGLSISKCAECMAMSRSSAFRLLNRAHVAVNNRYQRMKGAENETYIHTER